MYSPYGLLLLLLLLEDSPSAGRALVSRMLPRTIPGTARALVSRPTAGAGSRSNMGSPGKPAGGKPGACCAPA